MERKKLSCESPLVWSCLNRCSRLVQGAVLTCCVVFMYRTPQGIGMCFAAVCSCRGDVLLLSSSSGSFGFLF
ncbi:unnamed protein product [Lathyrus sativus]|nr:unnamed protein product [Lathyrus sativus]